MAASTRPNGASLITMPTEIVELVMAKLQDPRDYLVVRQVNRLFNDCSLRYFGQFWLHTVDTDLSLASIHRLQWLAQKTKLGKYVKEINFCRDRNSNAELGRGYEQRWKRDTDRGCLIEPFPANGLLTLTEILRTGLPNCRQYHVYTNMLDSNPEPWEHWDDGSDHIFPSDVVNFLFHGLLQNARVPVRGFHLELYGRPNSLSAGLISPTLAILDNAPDLWTSWQSLSILELEFLLGPPDSITDFCIALLRHATSLKELVLDVGPDHSSGFVNRLIQSEATCSNLKELSLRDIMVSKDDLLPLLERSRISLRRLYIRSIILVERTGMARPGFWTRILHSLHEQQYNLTHFWFENITDRMMGVNVGRHQWSPHFDRLDLSMLPQCLDLGLQSRVHVSWLLNTQQRPAVILGVQYQGPDCGQALKKICEASRTPGTWNETD